MLTPELGRPVALERLALDPDRPTYWNQGQTFGDLRPHEGWVVAGERPEGQHRREEPDVPLSAKHIRPHPDLPGIGTFSTGPFPPPVVPTPDLPKRAPRRCTAEVYIEPDGSPSRIDRSACPIALHGALDRFLEHARWTPPTVGSEIATRAITRLELRFVPDRSLVEPDQPAVEATRRRRP